MSWKLPSLIAAAAASTLLLASCASLSITNIAPLVPESDVELMRGRRIYLTTCVRCHAPEPVAKYSKAEWIELMPEMIEDSRLNDADAKAVMRYVLEAKPLPVVPAS